MTDLDRVASAIEDIASGGTQCGTFRFQEDPSNGSVVDVMSGCVLTCDYDGCNTADVELTMSTFTDDVVHYFVYHPSVSSATGLAAFKGFCPFSCFKTLSIFKGFGRFSCF